MKIKASKNAPAAAAPADAGEVHFSPRQLMEFYLREDYDGLTRSLLSVLTHFAQAPPEEPDPAALRFVDLFVENLLFFFTKEDYQISEAFAPRMVRMNPVVANLVAMSKFETTDAQVEVLRGQAGNFLKLLVLHNARNATRLPIGSLFEAHPAYASLWYARYWASVESGATEITWRNLRDHLREFDSRFQLAGQATVTGFFEATYVDPDRQRPAKAHASRLLRGALASIRIRNRPRPNRIAVVTSRWIPTTSVYRSAYPFLATLAGDYELTLVHPGPLPEAPRTLDDSLFADVRHVAVHADRLDIDSIADNDFQLAYFPDVGMTRESLYLASLRIAPIQVVGHGHPVSTFGARMDYFLSGREAEIVADARENYSERLVLLPGIGVLPVWPEDPVPDVPRPHEPVRINCPWTAMKVNHPLLEALRQIASRAGRKVVFQFFPGPSIARLSAALPFRQDVESVLGAERVRIVPNRARAEYMREMARGHLTLEPYPFGGYNTTVDALSLRQPVVSWEGTKFYNRAASALLRRAGLGEWVATGAAQYVEKALALVGAPARREEVGAHLARTDLKARLVDAGEADAFRRAIDFLIAHHDQLQADETPEPILIE